MWHGFRRQQNTVLLRTTRRATLRNVRPGIAHKKTQIVVYGTLATWSPSFSSDVMYEPVSFLWAQARQCNSKPQMCSCPRWAIPHSIVQDLLVAGLIDHVAVSELLLPRKKKNNKCSVHPCAKMRKRGAQAQAFQPLRLELEDRHRHHLPVLEPSIGQNGSSGPLTTSHTARKVFAPLASVGGHPRSSDRHATAAVIQQWKHSAHQ